MRLLLKPTLDSLRTGVTNIAYWQSTSTDDPTLNILKPPRISLKPYVGTCCHTRCSTLLQHPLECSSGRKEKDKKTVDKKHSDQSSLKGRGKTYPVHTYKHLEPPWESTAYSTHKRFASVYSFRIVECLLTLFETNVDHLHHWLVSNNWQLWLY